jgi:hypothetical protein
MALAQTAPVVLDLLLAFSDRKLQPPFRGAPSVPRSGIKQTEDLKCGLILYSLCFLTALKHILTL